MDIKKKLNKKKFKSIYQKNSYYFFIVLVFIGFILFSLGTINYFNNQDETNGIVHRFRLLEEFIKEKEIPELIIEKKKTHVSLETIDDGYDIYKVPSGGSGYRYGPSIIINDDGSLDAWFASSANNIEWDWITYRHSDDGINWDEEKIVLQPTADSMDHYSVCDPGVIYFNDYYYLGYTSTIVETNEGINNNVFVARSKNPDGPFEKWNGNGWGGKPQPIIYFNESNDFWGAGEISFVIVDDTLYCYYTWNCEHESSTRVQTAKLTDDWPSTLTYQGIIYDYNYGQDSCDVVYLEEYKKFLAFSIGARFSSESSVLIYESDDGVKFKKSDLIHNGISMYAHNMGISKHLNGHISENDSLIIGYAYGSSSNSKGRWATRFQPVNLIIYEDTKYRSYDNGSLPTQRTNIYSSNQKSYFSGIGVKKRNINLNMNDTATITTIGYNQNHATISLKDKPSYEYDKEIINIVGNKIIPIKQGSTVVLIKYGDFYTTCTVTVRPNNFDYSSNNKEIIKFEPVQDEFIFHLENENYHTAQIRAYVEFSNGTWGEAYNDYSYDHPDFPAMIDASYYHMDYEVENNKIAEVSDDGIITPKSVGETNIKVTMNDDLEFVVHIKVEF